MGTKCCQFCFHSIQTDTQNLRSLNIQIVFQLSFFPAFFFFFLYFIPLFSSILLLPSFYGKHITYSSKYTNCAHPNMQKHIHPNIPTVPPTVPIKYVAIFYGNSKFKLCFKFLVQIEYSIAGPIVINMDQTTTQGVFNPFYCFALNRTQAAFSLLSI